jgi:L-serine dehydratase
MAKVRSVFDVIGPVMVGPSSSHTAGAARLGRLARAILGRPPVRARITLHGSFASTGQGHGTDLALVAGLLGMAPDDERIPVAHRFAESAGLTTVFLEEDLGEVHPNTARIELESADGTRVTVEGSSIGGADILITRIDGFVVAISGELPVLIVEHTDRPGVVAAVTSVLAAHDANIASMEVSRERRGARALMVIETDQTPDDEMLGSVATVEAVTQVRTVPAV